MRKLLELSLWQIPRWVPYTSGVVLVAAITIFRYQSSPFFGDKGSLLFFTLPIVISAFIGGFGPGIFTAILSLLTAKFLFIPDLYSFNIADPVAKVGMMSSAINWLVICIICELLREAARSYRGAASERDYQRDHLSVVLDSISDGFFAVDNDWRITHANRAMREMVGQYATVDSQVLWDFLPPEQEHIKQQLIEAKNSKQFVILDVPERDDGPRWFQFRAFPEEQGVFVYMQDITDRKEAQMRNERILADERRARSEAEKASRLRDEFVATVSHELRTPLVSILGWAELLQRRSHEDSYIKEGLSAIESSSKQQAKLIEELLDISRMSAGKVPMNMEVVMLPVVIEEAALGCSLAANNKAIELRIDLPSQDVLINGDAGRLHQIVTNLISNAVKFTPRGGHVTVKLIREGNSAILTVQDDGEGIPASFLPFVFDRFRQANATLTRSQGGLGLGLSIVKQLVELHGGNIEAASEGPGKGSLFTITFPIDPILTQGPRDEIFDIKAKPLSNVKVMVLDDDEGTRDLLALILAESGADVNLAGDAESAFPLMESFQPDVLVSDIGMPGVDGYQFIERVRTLSEEKGGKVPAVALTAFAREEDRERALSAGFQEHLAKPIESSVLVQTLSRLIRSERPHLI
ncbi:MAG: response regulator [Armatimonadetes bacterium]|nr:response regulator [Armatimonadota bacterium]MBS1701799.1 response regulator [Armatimonadota bacterium]MBS1728683.1 response regulator [Armatimonadota bacterium]